MIEFSISIETERNVYTGIRTVRSTFMNRDLLLLYSRDGKGMLVNGVIEAVYGDGSPEFIQELWDIDPSVQPREIREADLEKIRKLCPMCNIRVSSVNRRAIMTHNGM